MSRGFRDDYISLTDIAKYVSDEPKDVVKNWMRTRSTLEFLGVWETLHNPDFKRVEFDPLLAQAGRNSFTMSPQKWITTVGAIGMRQKLGRNGGTFAHVDIAFEFASWVSPEFKLYVIKDYERLKADENSRLAVEWNERRLFSKINYRIHTDAIKGHLLPTFAMKGRDLRLRQRGRCFECGPVRENREAMARRKPDADGNVRDHATLHELIVLANLESMNAQLMKEGHSRAKRAEYLYEMAREQLAVLRDNPTLKRLEGDSPKLGAAEK